MAFRAPKVAAQSCTGRTTCDIAAYRNTHHRNNESLRLRAAGSLAAWIGNLHSAAATQATRDAQRGESTEKTKGTLSDSAPSTPPSGSTPLSRCKKRSSRFRLDSVCHCTSARQFTIHAVAQAFVVRPRSTSKSAALGPALDSATSSSLARNRQRPAARRFATSHAAFAVETSEDGLQAKNRTRSDTGTKTAAEGRSGTIPTRKCHETTQVPDKVPAPVKKLHRCAKGMGGSADCWDLYISEIASDTQVLSQLSPDDFWLLFRTLASKPDSTIMQSEESAATNADSTGPLYRSFSDRAKKILSDMASVGLEPQPRMFEIWAIASRIMTFRDAIEFLDFVESQKPGMASEELYALLIGVLGKQENWRGAWMLFRRLDHSSTSMSGPEADLESFTLAHLQADTTATPTTSPASLAPITHDTLSSPSSPPVMPISSYPTIPPIPASNKTRPQADLKAYTAMIGVLCRSKSTREAAALALRMTMEANISPSPQLAKYLLIALSEGRRAAVSERSIAIYRNLLKTDQPTISSFVALEVLMYALLQTGDPAGAVQVFNRVLELSNKSGSSFPTESVSQTSASVAFSRITRGCVHLGVRAMMRCGQVTAAVHTVSRMRELGLCPNLATYNVLIDGFALNGDPNAANQALDDMIQEGITPSALTMTLMIKSHVQGGDMHGAMEWFQHMVGSDLQPGVQVFTQLIKGYFATRDVQSASNVYSLMADYGVKPNIVWYTCMIDLYAKENNPNVVQDLLADLERNRALAEKVEATATAGADRTDSDDKHRKSRNQPESWRQKLEPDTVFYNTFVHAHARNGDMANAEEVVKTMVARNCVPDVTTYSILVYGYVLQGRCDLATHVVTHRMKRARVSPNVVTYEPLIRGLLDLGDCDEALKYFPKMCRVGWGGETGLRGRVYDAEMGETDRGQRVRMQLCGGVLLELIQRGALDHLENAVMIMRRAKVWVTAEIWAQVVEVLVIGGRVEEARGLLQMAERGEAGVQGWVGAPARMARRVVEDAERDRNRE